MHTRNALRVPQLHRPGRFLGTVAVLDFLSLQA